MLELSLLMPISTCRVSEVLQPNCLVQMSLLLLRPLKGLADMTYGSAETEVANTEAATGHFILANSAYAALQKERVCVMI